MKFWGVHASRVWAKASRLRELSKTVIEPTRRFQNRHPAMKDCFDETSKPTRETRALPDLKA